jgi:hypothetical protein
MGVGTANKSAMSVLASGVFMVKSGLGVGLNLP